MPFDVSAIGKKLGPFSRHYTWKDLVLYAVGVGAGVDDLEYCYEKRLKAIPSFAVVNTMELAFEAVALSKMNVPASLHGEQDLILHHPIPPEGGTLTTEGMITGMYDWGQGKGACFVTEADTYHSNGQKLFTNIGKVMCRADGGFGGPRPPKEDFVFPARAPDYEEVAQMAANQHLIYRLSGDFFPLHCDPEVAHASGYEQPIMHGLCTYGFACRAVVKHLMPGEPERLTRFRCRFAKWLYPGQPIKTQIWRIAEGKAFFKTINSAANELVIDRGIVEWQG